MLMALSQKLVQEMEKQQYRIVGNHSSVKLCHWTKKSLRDEGVCYKQKFYGIQSHRCLQMTPATAWCPNRCLYCWRAAGRFLPGLMDKVKLNEPEEILDGCIAEQRKLLVGYNGFSGVNRKKFEEAQDPNQVAISLTGEPTLYPKLSEFIELCKRRKMTTFLVTNGQFPEALEKTALPYQFYLSLDAPNREVYNAIDCPSFKDYWERLMKSVELMSSMKCRKVVRLTLVKGWNMEGKDDRHIAEYARLIEKSGADFIEAKAYMFVGASRKRLPMSAMPFHKDVVEFSKKLEAELGGSYGITDESAPSRVVLLKKK